ncbi:MAG: hypothetical protein Q4B77_05250 [Coriobacteriaceae bacterium]|nr:hypothetical protein [Coriobacteriaceae bacterium]
MSPIPHVVSHGKQIRLRGSLPGSGVAKGEKVSIAVTANDGEHRKKIKLTKKLNEGGEGAVFTTDAGKGNNYVAKIYFADKLTDTKFDKLKLMLSKSIKDPCICFPVALIENELGENVGFLMPQAKGVELGKSVFMPKLLQKHFPTWTKRETIQLCLTILKKIRLLNSKGIILGDINGQNFLVVSPTEVYFVDCDSYQIGSYPCPAGTVHFTAPEAQGRNYKDFMRTQAMENFAIATLLFMIMLPGKSPYAAVGGDTPEENIRNGRFAYEAKDNSKVPPGKWGFIWSHMSYKVRQAFAETFRKDGSHFSPEKRLGADEWIVLFEKYLHGLKHMEEQDEMSLDLFPTRQKKRKCKKCDKLYVPDPNHYCPFCPECERREHPYRYSQYSSSSVASRSSSATTYGTQSRTQQQSGIWKSYQCANPKCKSSIVITNKERDYYKNHQLPLYCTECRRHVLCKRCGTRIPKWSSDCRDGLCRACAAKKAARTAAKNVPNATKQAPTASNTAKQPVQQAKNTGSQKNSELSYTEIIAVPVCLFIAIAIFLSMLQSCGPMM